MNYSAPKSVERPSSLEAQIEFVLAHPDMSEWIKQALRGALDCSPVEVLNDLEILNRILRAWSEQVIGEAGCHADTQTRPISETQ